jgi:hypothetical protein
MRRLRCALLKAERYRAGLGGCELEGLPETFADPKRSHELEAGRPSKALGVPLSQLWLFDFWPTLGFFTIASLK